MINPYYKDKITLLNAKYAEGLITKTQLSQYSQMLKKWTTISRKKFDVKVSKLKDELKDGEITKTDFKFEVKKLKKIVKPETKITIKQAEGVKAVLEAKVKIGKMTKTDFKIAVKKVETRTLITKAKFKAEVGSLKIKMQQGDMTPIKYRKEVK